MTTSRRQLLPTLRAFLLAVAAPLGVAQNAALPSTKLPPPTVADYAYGDHPRQRLDFWQAKSTGLTPLVIVIHGGGGDKGGLALTVRTDFLEKLLASGISMASINYRRHDPGVTTQPPVRAAREDAARALQTLRFKSKELNIDKTRVAVFGWSFGGQSALWLAFHDEMAKPASSDPIERESTRVLAVAVNRAQVTLDPQLVREWMPGYTYGGDSFGFETFKEFSESRAKVLPLIEEYSPLSHVTSDDPPVFLEYPAQKDLTFPGTPKKDAVHSVIHGMYLAEKLRAVDIDFIVIYTDRQRFTSAESAEFLIQRLRPELSPSPASERPVERP